MFYSRFGELLISLKNLRHSYLLWFTQCYYKDVFPNINIIIA